MSEENNVDAVTLATELTIAWLSNPNTRASAEDVPAFLSTMHNAVNGLSGAETTSEQPAADAAQFTPAVTARKSLASKDHIISLIDGKPYKTLRRHLSGHGLSPEQYRERYNLKADYPMVAPSYSEQRRAMAKKIGLGRKPGQKPAPQAAKSRRRTPAASTPASNDHVSIASAKARLPRLRQSIKACSRSSPFSRAAISRRAP